MFAMKKNNAFLYYCVSTVVLICMLTTWVVYVRFVADTVQNSGFSLNHVASSTISAITKPHTRSTDDILSQAGKEYKKVLETSSYVSNKFPQDFKYYYDLWDIDNDNIPEMIVIATNKYNNNSNKCIHVFSFKNGKLVKYPEIIDNAHDENENSGTIYFDPHHKGIVILRAIEKNSPNVFHDHEATVFLFDKKIPIITATHGTDSALCPPLPIDTKGLLLRDTGNDFGVLDSYFSKYSNTREKLTIAFKSFYYGGISNDDN